MSTSTSTSSSTSTSTSSTSSSTSSTSSSTSTSSTSSSTSTTTYLPTYGHGLFADENRIDHLRNRVVKTAYNVIDFRAVGDCQLINDGVMTNGSAVLTSVTGKFRASDVGKNIAVVGASSAADPGLRTTILSYQSASQVTLAASATQSTATAPVAWGTNDRLAIEAAIRTAFNSGGGVVIIPFMCMLDGNFMIVPAGVSMVGTNRYASGIVNTALNATGDEQMFSNMTINTFNITSYIGILSTGKYKFFDNLYIPNYGRFAIDLGYDGTTAQGSQHCYITRCHFDHNDLNVTNGGVVILEGAWRDIHILDNDFGNFYGGGNGCVVELYGVDLTHPQTFNNGLYFARNKCDGTSAKQGYFNGQDMHIYDNVFATNIAVVSGTTLNNPALEFITNNVDIHGNTFNPNPSDGSASNLSLAAADDDSGSNSIHDIKIHDNDFVYGGVYMGTKGGGMTAAQSFQGVRIYNNTWFDVSGAPIWVVCSSAGQINIERLSINDNDFRSWKAAAGSWAAIQFTAYNSASAILNFVSRVDIYNNSFGPDTHGASIGIFFQSTSAQAGAQILGQARLFNNQMASYTVVEDVVGTIIATDYVTAIASKSSAYTLTAIDNVILASGTTTITLPTAVGISGRSYTIKKTDVGGTTVTVATTSAQTIDGATTQSLTVQYQALTVASDGSNWQTIGEVSTTLL